MVERAPEWKRRYESGESVRSIGASCGVHWHTVLRQIKAAGAKIRGLRIRGHYLTHPPADYSRREVECSG